MKSALRVIAGHGGADPGAVSGEHVERELNIDVVLSFNDYASREYKTHNVTIVTYPKSDRDGNEILLEKIAQANAAGGDQLLIEVHHNIGAAGDGAQLWYSKYATTKAAVDETWQVMPMLQAELGFLLAEVVPVIESSRSRFGQLDILDNTYATAILIEVRNLDLVTGPQWEYSFGVALAKAMARYFGWPPAIEPHAPPPPPIDGKLAVAKQIVADAAAKVAAL